MTSRFQSYWSQILINCALVEKMVDTESQDMGRAEAGRAADLETSTFMLGMFMELLSAL